MISDNNNEGSFKRRKTDHQRLESWKAIANYLQRSVRTVRRWESGEGLPVHRHKHSKGSSVYAYRAELDTWKTEHRKALDAPPAPAPVSASQEPSRHNLAIYALVAVVAALLGTVAGKLIFEDRPDGNTVITAEDTWILLAEPTIDREYADLGFELNQALAREIGGSYRDLPLNRVESALRLMRRDMKSPLEFEIATEVALRDGEVRAVIIPRLERLGDGYVISAEIFDPHNDRLIAYPSEAVRGTKAILPAIERLGDDIRGVLSGLPVDNGSKRLDRVTTSSLQALRLYSRAVLCLDDNRPMVALELLDLAIEQDPEFASARILQALALKQQGASPEQYLQASAEAVSLGSQVNAAERYFIEGSHHHLSGDLNRANAKFRALLAIDADNDRSVQALLEICSSRESPDNCTDLWVRLADLRTESIDSNLQAAISVAMHGNDPALAAFYADRAKTMWRQNPMRVPPGDIAEILIFPVLNAWSTGDLQLALQESEFLKSELSALSPHARDATIKRLVDFSSILGRIGEAADLINLVSDPGLRREMRAAFLFTSGDMEGLRKYLASDADLGTNTSALLMTMVGLPDEAMLLLEELQSEGMNQASAAVIRARVALDSGDSDAVKVELHGAVEDLSLEDREFFFVGLETLAEVLNSSGQLVDAIRVLERTSPTRNDAVFNETGIYWLMCQRQLARLYRSAGRNYDAAAIEGELLKLLALADQDFFLRTSLDQA
jgi:hypothetical protein